MGGGGGEKTKKKFMQGKCREKNSCKEERKEKNSCRKSEFLLESLSLRNQQYYQDQYTQKSLSSY